MNTGKPRLTKGEQVMIYEDPFTQKREEGGAKCLEFISVCPGVPYSERWLVRFFGADEPIVERTIAW